MDVYRSPYLPLYEKAASRIEWRDHVLDIGSGTGRFAKLLHDAGHPTVRYMGIDFSKVNLNIARQYCPGYAFIKQELETIHTEGFHGQYDIYVALEVLEHLENDLGVIKAIPKGSRILFSVPDYDSPAHVRFFKDSGEIRERYDGLIKFSLIITVPIKTSWVFLCDGIRKG